LSFPEVLRRHPLRALLALALLLGLSFQGTRGLWEPDEGRYTNVALQMLHGGDWVSLRRNETALHFTKPPVTYWAIATSVSAFGRNEWAVRLPIALAYVLTILLSYRLGRQFVPATPWLPALLYASFPVPFFAANTVNTDTMLAAMETLAVACHVRARFGGGSARWLDAMWAVFGLAFLTKGPPALLPLAAILVFELSQKSALQLLRPLGLLAFAVVGFTWFAVVIHLHPGLLDYFLGHEVYARIATDQLKRFPQWYGPLVVYLPTLLLGTLPWLPVLARRWWRAAPTGNGLASRWRQLPLELKYLLCWLLLPLLVFCLARSRLPLYLLPCFAPLALLIARGLGGLHWTRLRVGLLAAWFAALLGVKYYVSAVYPSGKDARTFATELAPSLPGHPDHFMFVEDMTRNGLNLYFDSDIQRLSFKPQEQMISDSSYDQTVAAALARPQHGRVFVMKHGVEAFFLEEVRRAGRTPVKLAELPDLHGSLGLQNGWPTYRFNRRPDRVAYTLAGDFPAAGPPAAD
jgi:4-amino-4-deoxy-L-arabinose transferase-like glycosyltransferase